MTLAGSQKLGNGSKARQRNDREDRNLPFSNVIRSYGIPATDVDFVVTNGKDVVRLVLEVTRPDQKVFSPKNYLASIDDRRKTQNNDKIIHCIGKLLGAETILVVFQPDIEYNPNSIVWWRHIQRTKWREERADLFLKRIKRYALKK